MMCLKKNASVYSVTAAVLTLSAQAALAQTNVTLYGIVDAGVEAVNHTGAAADTSVRVGSGSSVGSRWGIRGVEDLGGGLKAIFNLENGFNVDTGTLAQGGRLFGRTATVGLQGAWGSVQLGRQINSMYELGIAYDPVGYTSFGLPVIDGNFLGRADNSVKYSYQQAGLSTSVLYSFGRDGTTGTPAGSQAEVAGESKVGREIGVTVGYSSGPFKISAGYDQQHGTSVATQSDVDRRYLLSALYNLGKTRLYAGFQYRDNELDAGRKTKLYWIGLNQAITEPLSLGVGVYHVDPGASPAKASLLSTTLKYGLSKRSSLYLNAAYARNSGLYTQGVTGATGASAVLPNGNQSGVATGIIHSF